MPFHVHLDLFLFILLAFCDEEKKLLYFVYAIFMPPKLIDI